MIAILSALAPVIILAALGYALARTNFGGKEMWNALDRMTFYVLFPSLLAKTLMRADLASVPAGGVVFVSVASITIMAAAAVATYIALGRPLPGPTFTSCFQGVIRFQSTMVVAITGALYGERGLTFAALSVASLVPVAQIYAVLVLLIFGKGNEGVRFLPILKGLALNPPMLGCAAGLLLNATGVPDFVFETVSLLGSASIALVLLSTGSGLDLGAARASFGLVAANSAIRLIMMPALVFFLCWLVGLTGLARTVAVIAGAVPAASTAYTMARIMGGDAELMAQLITFQAIASALTLPLFIYAAQSL
jgi:malonate transporter